MVLRDFFTVKVQYHTTTLSRTSPPLFHEKEGDGGSRDAKKIQLQRPPLSLIVALGELRRHGHSPSPKLAGSTYPSVTSDCKRQLYKRHILAGSSTGLMSQ